MRSIARALRVRMRRGRDEEHSDDRSFAHAASTV
jgi:hypothetical protein